ncbi:MAG: hypothetical protein KZQ58_02225 [gamma proteobacterium symbiont of Bathyaustriella thionipta]|nr:hypothetical protein [gamma proteobacterium symbiont of Bathyaustriella thionipta]
MSILTIAELEKSKLAELLQRYAMQLEMVQPGQPIAGSWWGESEAGLIANRLLVRPDTPVHSALHEACHYICMDVSRRSMLHTNAGGDYDEENAVCYLQTLLADYVPPFNRQRSFADMDEWGYSFRLGSAQAWFEQDAEDARQWLLHHQLIDARQNPSWNVRIN